MVLDTEPSRSLYLTPTDDLAVGTLALSVVLSVLTLVTVSLRCWLRLREQLFGADDAMMLLGMLTFQATCCATAYSCFIGIGSHDALITEAQNAEGHKYLLIWDCLYFTAAMFVKCAISMTMLRVAVRRSHKVVLWVIIALVVATGLTGVVGGLAVCYPIEKNWDLTATPEDCAYGAVMVIGLVVTASTILTDFACAGLPVLVLWDLQMDRRTKILTWFMLALGASASLSTIVRVPYLKYWSITDDQLYNIANVIIWSMFECGIGIVAGSLSMLRRLVVRWFPPRKPGREEAPTPLPPTRSLITIGAFASGPQVKARVPHMHQSKPGDPARAGAGAETSRGAGGAYEELSGSSAGKASVSEPRGARDGVEMADLGHKRRQGSDATDERPLRETF